MMVDNMSNLRLWRCCSNGRYIVMVILGRDVSTGTMYGRGDRQQATGSRRRARKRIGVGVKQSDMMRATNGDSR